MAVANLARRNDQIDGSKWTLRPWMIASLIALSFLVLRAESLNQPPVWDGAMGMTPAALTLESTDFDVLGLLGMPDYRAGGPNLHSLSIATWFVAFAIRVFGSYQAALPLLHVLSFLLVGLLGGGVFRGVRMATSNTVLAVVAALTSVVFPPMVVQASDVYLDLPLAVALTWTFVYLFESRLTPAISLLSLAAAIKPSALIAVPPIAYFVWRTERRRVRLSLLLLIPSAIALVPWLADAALRPRNEPTVESALSTFSYTVEYLRRMPLLIGFVLILIVSPMLVRLYGSASNRLQAILMSTVLFPLSFIYFFLLNPFVTKGITALPRYTTMFLPIAVLGFSVAAATLVSRRSAVAACITLACIFSLNLHGALEPRSSNAFWLAERSLQYENLLKVHEDAFSSFAMYAETMPSLYDHYAHYRIEYPEMGWTDGRQIPSGLNLNLERDIVGDDLTTLPDRFVMLVEGSWLGGGQLKDIRDTALLNAEYAVEIIEFEKSEFSSQVVIVTRTPESADGVSLYTYQDGISIANGLDQPLATNQAHMLN